MTGNKVTFHNWCSTLQAGIVPAVKENCKKLINFIGENGGLAVYH
jgi:hypothetical protein